MREGAPVPFGTALECLGCDAAFRECFLQLLRQAPFAAYRWETPPVSSAAAGRTFEFVLIDAPGLEVPADAHTFRAEFAAAQSGVCVFRSLGGDARLVAPTPDQGTPVGVYSHLAAFVRGAPDEQVHALWSRVGLAAMEGLDEKPLWISTHGGGVAWLHVRLDSRPKYYGYAPYRSAP